MKPYVLFCALVTVSMFLSVHWCVRHLVLAQHVAVTAR